MRRQLRIATLFIGLISAFTAYAQFPRTMSYQGIVADASGTPLTGNHQIIISLYTSPTGGTPVYSETHSNVNLVRGLYNITIGSITPIPSTLSFNTPYYLGVTLDGGTELPQRTALTAVPYALYADTANSAKTATRATSAASADDLAPTANVVRSLNGQAGELEIIGGGSTTVTRTGNTITIFSRDTSGSGGVSPITSVQPLDRSITVQNFFGPNVGIKIRENGVNTEQLADNAVITPKIIDEAITTAKLANFSVTTSKLVDGAVTTSKIANLAITNALLAANAVTTDKIMDGTIQTVDLADGSVTNPKLAPNAVTSDKIFDGTIQTVDLADGSVTNPKLAANAVTTDKIMDGQVQTADILNLNVTNAKLAADAVTTDKIMDGQVQTNDIANLNVTNGKLAADAVTTDKIQDGHVQTNDIANLNVTTAKLADGSVTNPKLGADAVTTDKILDLTVGTNDIANLAVTNAKLGADAVTTDKILDLAVGTGDLANLSVTNAKLAANAVDAAKISTAGATTNGQALIYNGATTPVWGNPVASGITLPYTATVNSASTLWDLTNTGTGAAGMFEINNGASLASALSATTNGQGTAATFTNTNASNLNNTVFITTNGNGNALTASNTGAGRAGYFATTSVTNSNLTLFAGTNGTGTAGQFQITNTANSQPAAVAYTNGTGAALMATNAGNGPAALFQATASTNTSSIVSIGNAGMGTSLSISNNNTANPLYAIGIFNSGIGTGISVVLNNFASTGRCLDVRTLGTGHSTVSSSIGGNGVWGLSGSLNAVGVVGDNLDGGIGVLGRTTSGPAIAAVAGRNDSLGYGVLGFSTANGIGVIGRSFTGVAGRFENTNAANTSDALQASTSSAGNAARFTGNVVVNGNLVVSGVVAKGGGSFRIDHPLDPQNKYLYHSFVESPEMLNIYNGTIQLDDNGEAIVVMPEWFQAVNRDFRYQLTAIGAPGPNLYIAEKITDNRFKIAGGQPGMEVSWEVSGVRHDRYSQKHRIPVEEMKSPEDRGRYLHPDVYGAPEETQIGRLPATPSSQPSGPIASPVDPDALERTAAEPPTR